MTMMPLYDGKVVLYTQQTYVGVGVGLGLEQLGLGQWLTDMLCNCWVYEGSHPYMTRPGVPTVASYKLDQKVHSWVVFGMYSYQ